MTECGGFQTPEHGTLPFPYATKDELIAEALRLRKQVDALVEALARLVADVQDYPAWERPCFAVDEALRVLAAVRSGKEKPCTTKNK